MCHNICCWCFFKKFWKNIAIEVFLTAKFKVWALDKNMFYCQTTSTVNTFGGSSFLKRYECVRRACPRRDLHIMTSSFLVCCSKGTFQFLRSDMISRNLFGEDWLHLFCYIFVRYLFMLGFKSLKNIGSSELSRFTANFARSSTCSLPGMPIWPGTQQKKILSSR